jgi:kinesin family protein 3/17
MLTPYNSFSIVKSDDVKGVIEVENPNDINAPIKCFSFDAVYSEGSSQRQLYNEAFAELVDSVLNGFNGTILAYGQTGGSN